MAKRNHNPVAHIFAHATAEELAGFLRRAIRRNPKLKDKLVAEFSDKLQDAGEAHFDEVIRQLRDDFSDRDGYIDYYKAHSFALGLCKLLEHADTAIANGLYREAFNIANAVAHAGASAYEIADDSDGSIADTVVSAFGTISKILALDVPTDLRAHILESLLADFDREDYLAYGFEYHPWEVVSSAQWSPGQVARIEAAFYQLLSGYKKAKPAYYPVTLNEHLHALYLHHDLDEQRELIEEIYGDSPVIRLRQVKLHMSREEYEAALELVRKALAVGDRHNVLGEPDWPDLHLRILYLQGNTAAARDALKSLYYSAGYHASHWYSQWKEACDATWPQALEELISHLSPTKEMSPSWLASVLREEQRWEELFALLQRYPHDFRLLADHADALREHYPAEMIDLFLPLIREEALMANKRSDYRRVCDRLTWIAEIPGGRAAAMALAAELRNTYPQRRAMQDELRKVVERWSKT